MLNALMETNNYYQYMDYKVFKSIYDLLPNIEQYSIENYEELKKSIIELIGEIVRSNGKKELYKYISQLSNVEYKTREFGFSKRDHVIHALLTFITGAYINEFFMCKHDSYVDSFQWNLASLFHDIGYASSISNELAYQQMQNMYGVINKLIESNLNKEIVDYYDIYSQLNRGKNAFTIIYDRLRKWKLDVEAIDKYVKGGKKIDHGVMSSLILLYTLDQVYQKYNPERKNGDCNVFVKIEQDTIFLNCSQDVFDEDITNVCAAIFIHNLDEKCFENKKIEMKNAKLAYLLKLSDELQDWNRTVFENHASNPSELFDITIRNSKLLIRTTEDFCTKINKFLDSQDLIVNENN